MPDVAPFQHRERILERFATAGSSRDRSASTGLGPALVTSTPDDTMRR